MINIKYKNQFGSEISASQLKGLEVYEKILYDFDRIKQKELIENVNGNIYHSIKYFVTTIEKKESILSQLSETKVYSSVTIYFNKEAMGDLVLWDYEVYNKGTTLKIKGKEVIDEKDRTIMSCTFDISTGAVKDQGIKNYYNEKIGASEFPMLRFTYNSNGVLDRIFDVQEIFGFVKSIPLKDFLTDIELAEELFPWNEHSYYHALLPFLPSGPL